MLRKVPVAPLGPALETAAHTNTRHPDHPWGSAMSDEIGHVCVSRGAKRETRPNQPPDLQRRSIESADTPREYCFHGLRVLYDLVHPPDLYDLVHE